MDDWLFNGTLFRSGAVTQVYMTPAVIALDDTEVTEEEGGLTNFQLLQWHLTESAENYDRFNYTKSVSQSSFELDNFMYKPEALQLEPFFSLIYNQITSTADTAQWYNLSRLHCLYHNNWFDQPRSSLHMCMCVRVCVCLGP